MPSIACASSQPISGFSGFPKLRQSVSAERLAAGAGDVPRCAEHGLRARGEQGRARRSDGPSSETATPAVRRRQTQDGRVQSRPPNGARLDELVVLLVDPRLALAIRGRDRGPRARRLRLLLDFVARTLVRQERGRDRALEVAAEEAAQLAGVGDRADHRMVQLPLVEHGLDLGEAFGLDHRDHPLLALGDHDLPGLHAVLSQRDAIQGHVHAGAVSRHLGER